MKRNETRLMMDALKYEEGHARRTQHILKVYALAKVFGEQEGLNQEEQELLQAAAILHDIPIKFCKEKYQGDASQENQQKEAPKLVEGFMLDAEYSKKDVEIVLDMVLNHHKYHIEHTRLLQILIEADLIINYYEEGQKTEYFEKIKELFVTETGRGFLLQTIKK